MRGASMPAYASASSRVNRTRIWSITARTCSNTISLPDRVAVPQASAHAAAFVPDHRRLVRCNVIAMLDSGEEPFHLKPATPAGYAELPIRARSRRLFHVFLRFHG